MLQMKAGNAKLWECLTVDFTIDRSGSVVQAASGILFLAPNASRWVTGHDLTPASVYESAVATPLRPLRLAA